MASETPETIDFQFDNSYSTSINDLSPIQNFESPRENFNNNLNSEVSIENFPNSLEKSADAKVVKLSDGILEGEWASLVYRVPGELLSLDRFLQWPEAQFLMRSETLSRAQLVSVWRRVLGADRLCGFAQFARINAEIASLLAGEDCFDCAGEYSDWHGVVYPPFTEIFSRTRTDEYDHALDHEQAELGETRNSENSEEEIRNSENSEEDASERSSEEDARDGSKLVQEMEELFKREKDGKEVKEVKEIVGVNEEDFEEFDGRNYADEDGVFSKEIDESVKDNIVKNDYEKDKLTIAGVRESKEEKRKNDIFDDVFSLNAMDQTE